MHAYCQEMPSNNLYFSVFIGQTIMTYDAIYEVVQANQGASVEPLWAVKITSLRNIEQLMRISGEYILNLPTS